LWGVVGTQKLEELRSWESHNKRTFGGEKKESTRKKRGNKWTKKQNGCKGESIDHGPAERKNIKKKRARGTIVQPFGV